VACRRGGIVLADGHDVAPSAFAFGFGATRTELDSFDNFIIYKDASPFREMQKEE
jgi:hypothetical protein